MRSSFFPTLVPIPHETSAPHCTTVEFRSLAEFAQGGSLPYAKLGGQGFERLCFRLLLAQGSLPRFSARSGQGQPGVDLICDDAAGLRVYECKNYEHLPTESEVREAYARFEKKWLGNAKYDKPVEFVYCCTYPFADAKLSVWFTELERECRHRTGVPISVWSRETLDAHLKRRPDLVSEFFSPESAKQFCHDADWRVELFSRVATVESARDPRVLHFLKEYGQKRIFVDEEVTEKIAVALDEEGVVAVSGPSAAGKTTAVLAALLELNRARRSQIYSVFYRSIESGLDSDTVANAIIQRASVPSVFILDDCHVDPDLAKTLYYRVGPEMRREKAPVRLVFLYRRHTAGTVVDTEEDELEAMLGASDAALNIPVSINRFVQVAATLRPALDQLTPDREKRLFAVCGGALSLLAEATKTIETPAQIDTYGVESLFKGVKAEFFPDSAHDDGVVKALAGLAQFGVMPRVSLFPGLRERLGRSWLERVGRPLRYQFLHTTLAELVFRALAYFDREEEPTQQAYLIRLLTNYLAQETDERVFEDDLRQLIGTGLRTFSSAFDEEVRGGVIRSETIAGRLRRDPVKFFAVAARCYNLLSRIGDEGKQLYLPVIEVFFDRVDEDPTFELREDQWSAWLALQRCLLANDAETLSLFENKLTPERFVKRLRINATLRQLFRYLANVSDGFARKIVNAMDDDCLDKVVQRTIDRKTSIGALSLTLRDFYRRSPTFAEALEEKVGASRYLYLLDRQGTVFELFRMLEHSSPRFARAILDELTEAHMSGLVARTIERERSVGTLHLTLRDLHRRSPTLAEALEEKMGASRYLYLLDRQGTVFELFRMLQYSSPRFARAILDELTEAHMSGLVARTVERERSVGTLDLTLRDLYRRSPTLAEALEEKMGASRYLYLLDRQGTVFELFRMLQHSSPRFARAILDELTEAHMSELVARTIERERSVGTLNFTLSSLGHRAPDLEASLCHLVGTHGFWRLVSTLGTAGAIVDLLRSFSPPFRSAFLEEAPTSANVWAEIFQRGRLDQAARLLADFNAELPPVSQAAIDMALSLVGPGLVGNAEWFSITTTLKLIEEAGIDSPLRRMAITRISEATLAQIVNLDLTQAANAFKCLWDYRPDLREELKMAIWHILPPEQTWGTDGKTLSALNGPLLLCQTGEIPEASAWRLSNACFSVLGKLSGNIFPRQLALFLWNLMAAEAGALSKGIQAFELYLEPRVEEKLFIFLDRKVATTSPLERLNVLVLAGALAVALPHFRLRLADSLRGKIKGVVHLRAAAGEAPFVTGYLALTGLSLFTPVRQNFSQEAIRLLILRSEELNQVAPSIRIVLEDLERLLARPSKG